MKNIPENLEKQLISACDKYDSEGGSSGINRYISFVLDVLDLVEEKITGDALHWKKEAESFRDHGVDREKSEILFKEAVKKFRESEGGRDEDEYESDPEYAIMYLIINLMRPPFKIDGAVLEDLFFEVINVFINTFGLEGGVAAALEKNYPPRVMRCL